MTTEVSTVAAGGDCGELTTRTLVGGASLADEAANHWTTGANWKIELTN
jgi:hypothetical protein